MVKNVGSGMNALSLHQEDVLYVEVRNIQRLGALVRGPRKGVPLLLPYLEGDRKEKVKEDEGSALEVVPKPLPRFRMLMKRLPLQLKPYLHVQKEAEPYK